MRLAGHRGDPREPNPENLADDVSLDAGILAGPAQLLMQRRNQKKWAAYHGNERVTIARSDVDAYQECFRRGLKHGRIYVGKLKPDPDGIPPWGTIQSDWSFYEFTDPDKPAVTTHEDPRLPAHHG